MKKHPPKKNKQKKNNNKKQKTNKKSPKKQQTNKKHGKRCTNCSVYLAAAPLLKYVYLTSTSWYTTSTFD